MIVIIIIINSSSRSIAIIIIIVINIYIYIYIERERDRYILPRSNRIALSTLGVAITLLGLAWAASAFGGKAVLVHYFLPYLWANFWLVLYTWPQRTKDNYMKHVQLNNT